MRRNDEDLDYLAAVRVPITVWHDERDSDWWAVPTHWPASEEESQPTIFCDDYRWAVTFIRREIAEFLARDPRITEHFRRMEMARQNAQEDWDVLEALARS